MAKLLAFRPSAMYGRFLVLVNSNKVQKNPNACKSVYVPINQTWNDKLAKVETKKEGTVPAIVTIQDPSFDKIDLSFEDAKEAFKSKRNRELLRSLLVFNMCSIPIFVNNNKELMRFGRKVLGKSVFKRLMKATFYGQFVAGEGLEEIKPLVIKNATFGVKSILDYSVEKDVSTEEAKKMTMAAILPEIRATYNHNSSQFLAHEEFADRRELVTGARTYFYEDEAHCDTNMEIFLRCIDAVSGATNSTGFAAIKMTALGRPQFLLQLSEMITRVRQHFEVLQASSGNEQGCIDQADFESYLKSISLDRDERKRWYTVLDTTNDGQIDMLDWFNLLEVNLSLIKLLRVPNIHTGELEPLVHGLSEEEENQMKNMLRRIDTIAKYSKEQDVRVMVDAEQTYFQPAITRLTVEMMRKYNKEKAIIFNTYQCYLKSAFAEATLDLALSAREDFYFGAKIVRGAYIEQERKRAMGLGYDDPTNPSFDATTDMYQKVLTEFMRQIQERPRGKIAVMIASHNEETVSFTINKMKEYGISSSDRVVCFGQLLGMCDQVSFSLGQAGYSVYKYVPYGPVDEVLPYLSRRAQENQGLLAKVKKEKRLLRRELFRRLATLHWFYRPPSGPFAPSSKILPKNIMEEHTK